MSKAQLKKELATLNHDQLIEVILNAYSSSKEAKAYFEFFINPDVDALYEKKIDVIAKEISRSKHGYCKARISAIRAAIKDFAAYGVGDEYVHRLIYNTIRMMVGMERFYYFTEPLFKGVDSLTDEFMVMANKMECVPQALELLERINTEQIGRPAYRERVMAAAQAAVRRLGGAKY